MHTYSEINVTPLVDVCLVLLVIFMVVVPAMVNGVPVNLPRTSETAGVPPRSLPLTLQEDGTVIVDATIIRREQLGAELLRMHARESARPIVVRADKHLQYGDVAKALAECRTAGWENVALAGEPLPH